MIARMHDSWDKTWQILETHMTDTKIGNYIIMTAVVRCCFCRLVYKFKGCMFPPVISEHT